MPVCRGSGQAGGPFDGLAEVGRTTANSGLGWGGCGECRREGLAGSAAVLLGTDSAQIAAGHVGHGALPVNPPAKTHLWWTRRRGAGIG